MPTNCGTREHNYAPYELQPDGWCHPWWSDQWHQLYDGKVPHWGTAVRTSPLTTVRTKAYDPATDGTPAFELPQPPTPTPDDVANAVSQQSTNSDNGDAVDAIDEANGFKRVPSCDGLDYGACSTKLEEAGFSTHHRSIVDLDSAVIDEPAGAVIRTSPATSEKARITSDIGVVTNPDREPERIPYQPATGDGQNPCEPSPQGYEPPSLEGPFRLVDTLRGPGRAPVVHLYEGIYENQWGYRHILIDHGWGAVDRDETELALHFGYEEQGSDRPGAIDSWTYYLSTPSRNGVPCARIVVLELGTHSGEPDPRHIITSFAAPKA